MRSILSPAGYPAGDFFVTAFGCSVAGERRRPARQARAPRRLAAAPAGAAKQPRRRFPVSSPGVRPPGLGGRLAALNS